MSGHPGLPFNIPHEVNQYAATEFARALRGLAGPIVIPAGAEVSFLAPKATLEEKIVIEGLKRTRKETVIPVSLENYEVLTDAVKEHIAATRPQRQVIRRHTFAAQPMERKTVWKKPVKMTHNKPTNYTPPKKKRK